MESLKNFQIIISFAMIIFSIIFTVIIIGIVIFIMVNVFKKGGVINTALEGINTKGKAEKILSDGGEMLRGVVLDVKDTGKSVRVKGIQHVRVLISLEAELPDGKLVSCQSAQYVEIVNPVIKGSMVDIVYNDNTGECVVVH